jgi:hypothetical protein
MREKKQMCDCGDFDPPSVFDERMVTARKSHRCSECSRTIQKGERYKYIFGVWDGDARSFHTCAECLSAWEWFNKEYECDCYIFGEMLGEFLNMLPYPNAGDNGALQSHIDRFAARRKEARELRKAALK